MTKIKTFLEEERDVEELKNLKEVLEKLSEVGTVIEARLRHLMGDEEPEEYDDEDDDLEYGEGVMKEIEDGKFIGKFKGTKEEFLKFLQESLPNKRKK